MVDKVPVPHNAAITGMLDKLRAGVLTSPICGLYDDLMYKAHGMNVEHANEFARAVLAVRLDAWQKANPLLKVGKKSKEPKWRRADATAIRDVLSMLTIAKAPREKTWKFLCGLTNDYGKRAAVAGEIVAYHEKQGKVPNEAWVEKSWRMQLLAKKPGGKGKNKKTVTKASVYMQRIIDACGRMTEGYAGQHKAEIALMLRTAKATQKLCVVAEEAAAKASD